MGLGGRADHRQTFPRPPCSGRRSVGGSRPSDLEVGTPSSEAPDPGHPQWWPWGRSRTGPSSTCLKAQESRSAGAPAAQRYSFRRPSPCGPKYLSQAESLKKSGWYSLFRFSFGIVLVSYRYQFFFLILLTLLVFLFLRLSRHERRRGCSLYGRHWAYGSKPMLY
jgi:hypothetical protein